MSDSYYDENRKFLHDIANPLTLLKLMMKSISKQLSKENIENVEKLNESLQKAHLAIEKLENLHADFKAEIETRSKSQIAS